MHFIYLIVLILIYLYCEQSYHNCNSTRKHSFVLDLPLDLLTINYSPTFFFFFLLIRRPPRSPFFPYTPLFRSSRSGDPAELVESAPPRVPLRTAFAHPFDSAIAAARTCYSSRLINPEEVNDKQRLDIGAATFFSGHHTVYQHAHFEFGLENISRQFVWSFLHPHPFYNSHQPSHPSVPMDRTQAYVPQLSLFFDAESRAIYERAIARAWSYYRELSSLLLPQSR